MVVDANSGRVLYANAENELRHPASITKVMTLYLLFEQLEKGRMRLGDEIPVSAHAASMAPSKLGLRPGATIAVEDAIKAVVTKSANDIAVAIAEALGSSEDHFAEMMTAKAHMLGMGRTHYANASGLPDDEQVTTARDLTILGRAIQERFPRYYAYFSTHQFSYRGSSMANHNHLLGRVEGMDGIKTGYTRASGFNLLTSVKRGNRRIVSVVLGGTSASGRDRIMANLIEDHLEFASPHKTASVSETASSDRSESVAEAPAPRPEPRPVPAVTASAPIPAPPAPVAVEKPRPAVIANATRAPDDHTGSIPQKKQELDGSTRQVSAATATPSTTTPGGMRWVAGPAAKVITARPTEKPQQETRVARVEPAPAKVEPAKAEPRRPVAAHTGIMIQIGATDEMDKANDLLSRARGRATSLSGATSFTEKVQKGSETLYRARFAGLSENQAESACKTLKRSGFSCFTTKN